MVFEVVCIGSSTVDNFVSMQGSFSTIKRGVKILASDYMRHSGGGASNVAAALSKQGFKVGLITKLGNDEDADFLLDECEKFKVKVLNKKRSKHHTDNSTIVCSKKDKDRIIFVHKEASSDLNEQDISKTALKQAKWVYLSSLMGDSEKVMKKFMPYFRKNKINLFFNPSLYLAKQGARKLKPFLSVAKVLVLNKEEAQALLKDKRSSEERLCKKLHKLGPELVVITNCSRKAFAYDGMCMYSFLPPKVKVKELTGAGDAFNSGVLAGVLQGKGVEESLLLGQALASSVIQFRGTKHRLLSQRQAKQAVKKLRCKVQRKQC